MITGLGSSLDISEYGFRYLSQCLTLATYGFHTGVSSGDSLIDNHVERALDLILEQFEHRHDGLKSNNTNLKYTLSTFVEELQKLEYALQDTIVGRYLNYAVGDQLDIIGEIVGVAREIGETDADYRDDIFLKIAVNNSSGEAELLLAVARRLTRGDVIVLRELFPGKIVLYTNGIPTFSVTDISSRLDNVAAAGVAVTVIANAGNKPFRYREIGLTVPVYGDGYSELGYTPEVGGRWSELL